MPKPLAITFNFWKVVKTGKWLNLNKKSDLPYKLTNSYLLSSFSKLHDLAHLII